MIKKSTLLFLVFLGLTPVLTAQILINEVQTSNKSTLADEDGDYPDWLELYNAGTAEVNLDQYGLSDNPDEPFKWRFPSTYLEPGGHILVFASGKDRKPVVNHWETAVSASDTWKYFVGSEEPPYNWKELGFNATTWPQGPGGIGYGDDDDGTIIGTTLSVFMRRTFNVPDASSICSCIFSMDYDDGFVAYLNGIEIARSNLLGSPPAYDESTVTDHEAQMYQGGDPEHFIIDSVLLKSLLVSGNNVLAIQTHNSGILSSDLSSIPYLFFGIRNSATYFQSVPSWFPNEYIQHLHTGFKLKHSGETLTLTSPEEETADQVTISYTDIDHSHCRIPDGTGWCFTDLPSAGTSNNTSTCYQGYSAPPLITPDPGFYQQSIQAGLSWGNPAGTVHYTLNGSIPTTSDPIYTGPVNITSSRVLRARCFGPAGWLPGQVATSTFILGNNEYDFPVVSICTDSLNLWDWETGIYVMGPNADPNFPFFGANFWQPWEKDCHVEYFGTMTGQSFELDAGLSIHGGWTRAFDQKSFNIKTRPYYDSSEIHYKLFGEKPNIIDYTGFVIRNSGNDNLNTCLRDAFMQRIMKKTYVDYTSYTPAVVYLNGEYWGLYNNRERSNKDFVELNYGIQADSVDMIESDGIVAEGNADAFWEMVSFITTHELSIPENYAIARSWWNIENYADYFIAETYYVNNDWIGNWTNNLKLWRERKSGAKWNYVLWDLDFGLGLDSDVTQNKLSVAMNPPVPTPHADIFRGMLENQEFRHYFINRYADLINTIFLPVSMNQVLDEMSDSITEEIPDTWMRWRGYNGTTEWLGNISIVKNFIQNRPLYARQHINSTFGLDGQVQVKLAVLPESAGEIKINTIIPGPLPWTGTYFNGNSVTITAVAKPGFRFQYWLPNDYISMDTNRTLAVNLTHFDTFKAVFAGNPEEPGICINEINYHSDSTRQSGDWIELYNPSETSYDLTDWYLRDSDFYHGFKFATGTLIPAHGYLVIAEDPDLFQNQYPGVSFYGPLGFSLNNKGESITLFDRNDDTVSTVSYSDTVSWLLTADGIGRSLERKAGSTNLNDPANWFAGCMGGSPGKAYTPCNDPLLFSEINYNSADWADAGDWVEILNTKSVPLDISGWKFSDADDEHAYFFPAGTILLPMENYIIFSDEAKFETEFPWIQRKAGPFDFGLSGSGEALRLFDASGILQFSMIYNDENPWPAEPDGQGYTLELADVNGLMCEGSNWFAGCLEGSPGGPYVFPCHTGTDTNTEASYLIYPNPAHAEVFIRSLYPFNQPGEIMLFDAYGRLVYKDSFLSGIGVQKLETQSLPAGIYLLKIISGKENTPFTFRIVLSR